MEKTQTALQWYIDEISEAGFLWLTDKPEMEELLELTKRARALEKEQMLAYIAKNYGIGEYSLAFHREHFEKYYDETYGK